MRPDCVRRNPAVDIVLLVCAVGLAVATWAALTRTDAVGPWRHCVAVVVTMFLVLGAITPHEVWAASVRLAMIGWLMAAPCVLAFEELSPARWAYWITGALIAVLSAPDLLWAQRHGRSKMAALLKLRKEAAILPLRSADGAGR